MNVFDIAGRQAVVVGAGGLGRAIALGLAAHGARVAVADGDGVRANHVAEEVRAVDPTAFGLPEDVTSEESVQGLAAAVLSRFPCVDVLVNAAGATVRLRAEDLPVAEWRRILDVNATGTFICCQVFGAEMARRGGGAIVNLSSVRGRYGARFGQAE